MNTTPYGEVKSIMEKQEAWRVAEAYGVMR